MKEKAKVSKVMSYLLRHNPEGLELSADGFAPIDKLVAAVQSRYPWVNRAYVKGVVEGDAKGRYELAGDRIRAKYGHSIQVEPDLPLASVGKLYHGTTREVAELILVEGIKPMDRRKVHLSATLEDALEVGRRRTTTPLVLEVNAEKAIKEGVRICRASDKVYLADYIPPEFLMLKRERKSSAHPKAYPPGKVFKA